MRGNMKFNYYEDLEDDYLKLWFKSRLLRLEADAKFTHFFLTAYCVFTIVLIQYL
jgi:hypothetical protein